ncbi:MULTISPECIES: DUF2510 domain-containing protein [unclassified Diaminobutyricimonas]|uniref:DUF2510 domain-containing protein n=1 Tax=unclassified Diaminobutyricimonas TaxID=2643261 RepID=UPI0012F52786|nr:MULTISPECIES: DUF2510 domain-containing protein [unclassified Diaminobutyricimonas]
MTTAVPSAPAGWYPDPLGTTLLRWWNGDGWTDRVEQRRPEIQLAPGAIDWRTRRRIA